MKLYHGTTAAVARSAITTGIWPRRLTGSKGHWQHRSKADMVYLTTAYAPFYAASACNGNNQQWGILEVETNRLDESLLRPDEDWLEQSTRVLVRPEAAAQKYAAYLREAANALAEELYTRSTMWSRTAWYRDHLDRFAPFWRLSLDGMGTCAHKGAIPARAITRAVTFNPRTNQALEWDVSDPTVTIMNYQWMGAKYRLLTKWFFRPVSVGEYLRASMLELHKQIMSPEQSKDFDNRVNAMLSDRTGITELNVQS